MNKVLLSVLALALVGALAGGGLFAYFSDTEVSTGNTFKAGTIEIGLAGDIGLGVHATLVDFKPCETGYLVFTVTNEGLNPTDVWKLIYDVDCWEYLPSENGDPNVNNIDEFTHFGMWVEGGNIGPETGGYHTCDGDDTMLVDEALGLFVSPDIVGNYMYLGRLGVGESMTVVQTFHMDGVLTTNWAQGDKMQFNEDYLGQQTTAPSPTPELGVCAK